MMTPGQTLRMQEMARSRMSTSVDYDPADASVAKTVVLPHVMHRIFDQPAPTPLEGLALVDNALFGASPDITRGLGHQFESALKQAKRLAADPSTEKAYAKTLQKLVDLMEKMVAAIHAAKKAQHDFHEEIHY